MTQQTVQDSCVSLLFSEISQLRFQSSQEVPSLSGNFARFLETEQFAVVNSEGSPIGRLLSDGMQISIAEGFDPSHLGNVRVCIEYPQDRYKEGHLDSIRKVSNKIVESIRIIAMVTCIAISNTNIVGVPYL